MRISSRINLPDFGLFLGGQICPSCQEATLNSSPLGLCEACVVSVMYNDDARCSYCDHPGEDCCEPDLPGHFDALRSAWLYGGAISSMIARGKYRGTQRDFQTLANAALQDPQIKRWLFRADLICAVPQSYPRYFSRGFNQAELIARTFAKAYNTPHKHLLRTYRVKKNQAGLGKDQRLREMRNTVRSRAAITEKVVVLVDDVATTTATLQESARALKEAGARNVLAITLARTQRF